MQEDQTEESINFFEAVFGLLLDPGATTEALLKDKRPRFAVSLTLAFIVTILAPMIAQMSKLAVTSPLVRSLISVSVVVCVSVMVFGLLEGLLLELLSFQFTMPRLMAVISYCLTPLTVAIWLIYGFNYFTSGRLSLVSLLLTGYGAMDDRFLKIVPIAAAIALLMMLLNFFHSVRAMGKTHRSTAFALTVVSLIPLVISVAAGLMVGELTRPGTVAIFGRILASPHIWP